MKNIESCKLLKNQIIRLLRFFMKIRASILFINIFYTNNVNILKGTGFSVSYAVTLLLNEVYTKGF